MSDDTKKSRKTGYAVGYGKPPAAHRFEAGRSGNPKGRPRKATSFGEVFAGALASSTATVINGKRRRKTIIDIAVMRAMKDIATGNPRALERWIPLMERYAPVVTPAPDNRKPDLSSLTTEQLRVLATIKLT